MDQFDTMNNLEIATAITADADGNRTPNTLKVWRLLHSVYTIEERNAIIRTVQVLLGQE